MKDKKSLFEKFWFWFLIFLLLTVVVCFFPYWFISRSWVNLDFNKTGQIGDTIGGIMGPFIAIVAAFLTFIAFWVQYRFNKEQILRFNKQESDLKVERFENRFFELLKIHRDNVQEFEIVRFDNPENKITGRRVFVSMVDELKFCYEAAYVASDILIGKNEITSDFYNKENLLKVAYLIFFDGDGINEERVIHSTELSNTPRYKVLGQYYDKILNELLPLIKALKAEYKKGNLEYRLKYKNNVGVNTFTDKTIYFPKLKYVPFAGHNSRLGHYFRHLYQTVKYVIEQDEKLFDDKEKYGYIRMIRAQLSNYEQVLLYYNSVSVFGKPWLDKKYLKDWRMIKNMPLYVANFGPLPKDILGETNSKGEKVFEVDEVTEAIAQ